MHIHRHQPGGLADDRGPRPGPARGGQGAGAVHGAFLISGGQQNQRLLQGRVAELCRRRQCEWEETLHVGAAEAVQTVVAEIEAEGIGLPAALVEGNRVGMSRQHQPARTGAPGRDQVGLASAGSNVLDFGIEAHLR